MKYSWKKTYKSNIARSVRRRKYSRSVLSALLPAVKRFFIELSFGHVMVLIGIACSLFLVYFVFLSSFFKIDTVQIVDDSVGQTIREKGFNRNILFVSVSSLRESVVANHPKVKDIIVNKKYPSSLDVQIRYREPLAVITTSQTISSKKEGERVLKMNEFLIDEAGVVYSASIPSAQLPKVDLGDREIAIGDRLESLEVETYLQVLANLREKGILTDWVKIIDKEIIEAKVTDGPTVLISSQKSAAEQIEALQVILTKYKIKEIPLAKIDLRFDKSVVEYKN